MPQKKATTKPHGLDKKKTDTLACASNTAFIPFGRENAWREIMDKYKKAADLLMNCVGEGSTIIQLPDTLIPSTLKEAYEVQAYIETPINPRVGWKLAATSIAGQKHIGVSEPIVGRITSRMSLSLDQFIPTKANNMMVAEPEFVFVFNQRIEPRNRSYTKKEALGLVSELKLGLEFPNSRFTKFETAGELSLIADNACAHEFMLGPAAPEIWRHLELSEHRVVGWVESKSKFEGVGSNVLGSPINALLWFLNEASKRKFIIKEGDFVTTGTTTQPIPFEMGDKIVADFGELGEVRCEIENY